MRRLLARLEWWMVGLLCLTLGLAPVIPEPHVWEKLKMLAAGDLTRPMDIFDLLLHGMPWMFALAKLALRPAR
ncbi:RND transporter [Sagittula sp. M10.9X]|uniref:RND transporter n=2 Tax=Sagittula salina TaxID=2820268 RepID=A0A940S4G4_9RHOB|nr:RND transporter [Sagittula salina]